MTPSPAPLADAGSPPRQPRGPLAIVLLATAFGLGMMLFLALGIWQVQRLGWKHDLIARVDARVNAAPVEAPDALTWQAAGPKEHEYRHVRIHGQWLTGLEIRVQAVTEAGAGRWLLRPLRRDDGSIVLVNLGFVPEQWHGDPAPSGEASVTGLLRLSEPEGAFRRRNAPGEGRWYSRDVAAITRHLDLGEDALPYFVDADAASATASGSPWPRGGLTVVRFRDNHLGYALTWFALALLVAGGAWRFGLEEVRIRRRWQQRDTEPMHAGSGTARPRKR